MIQAVLNVILSLRITIAGSRRCANSSFRTTWYPSYEKVFCSSSVRASLSFSTVCSVSVVVLVYSSFIRVSPSFHYFFRLMEQFIQTICGKCIHFFNFCCRPEYIPISCIMLLLQNANLCNTCDWLSKSSRPFWWKNVNHLFDRFALGLFFSGSTSGTGFAV